jgi:hypothetical protein
MDGYADLKMHKFRGTSLIQRIAKILIFLMVFQTWPLWELSQYYELNLGNSQRGLKDIGSYLSLKDAHAPPLLPMQGAINLLKRLSH